jgi:hypothetical protein
VAWCHAFLDREKIFQTILEKALSLIGAFFVSYGQKLENSSSDGEMFSFAKIKKSIKKTNI